MLLTEERAKKRWCPFARATFDAQQGVPIFNTLGGAITCAGSACMAWRWQADNSARDRKRRNDAGEAVGYCGLAGRPE